MLKEKILNELNKALKEKEELKVSTLRLLIAAIKNFEIAKSGTSYVASDEEIASIIQKEIKQRKESIEQFKAGDRQDLVDKETKETEILQIYLPKQISEQELLNMVEDVIKEVGASSVKDFGKVMGVLSQKVKGRADMSIVSGIIKRLLGS